MCPKSSLATRSLASEAQSITINGLSYYNQIGNVISLTMDGETHSSVTMISRNQNYSGTVALTGYQNRVQVFVTDIFGRLATSIITVNYIDITNDTNIFVFEV